MVRLPKMVKRKNMLDKEVGPLVRKAIKHSPGKFKKPKKWKQNQIDWFEWFDD